MAHESKFTLSLRLTTTGLIIYLLMVPYTLAKKNSVRHLAEKKSPLGTAWRRDQIVSALIERGYNFTFCKERHWKKYIPEDKIDDVTLKRLIRRLCQRYLLPNDADRLEARRKYQTSVRKQYRFDEMVRLILKKLSDYNETQEEILNNKTFTIDDDIADCYWKVYYSFSELCADRRFDFRARELRNIFANACRAPGLNADKIKQYFLEVCSDFKLYPW